MMTRRNADFVVAFGDLAFALAIFACGMFAAPTWLAGLAAAGMLAYWAYTRRALLKRLRGAVWASQTGIAIAVIIAIEVGAYWLGLGVGGNF